MSHTISNSNRKKEKINSRYIPFLFVFAFVFALYLFRNGLRISLSIFSVDVAVILYIVNSDKNGWGRTATAAGVAGGNFF